MTACAPELPPTAVVVAAAGQGIRFGGDLPKALELIAGRSLLSYALERIACASPSQVIVMAPPGRVTDIQGVCHRFEGLNISVTAGGIERSDSVALALAALNLDIEVVLIHDAARPFTPTSVFERVRNAVNLGRMGIVPVLPVVDTIKSVTAAGSVEHTVDRAAMRRVQTPQGFLRTDLVEAYRSLGSQAVTDDASVVELFGGTVATVAGDYRAFKVTDPTDRRLAEAMIAAGLMANDQAPQKTPWTVKTLPDRRCPLSDSAPTCTRSNQPTIFSSRGCIGQANLDWRATLMVTSLRTHVAMHC